MDETQKQIADIEKILREIPHHKGTDHYIGKMRARISRLRDKLYESPSKGSGGGGGYAVKKQGDATIVLAGPPSAGKSTLINKLTNAESKVADYAFTTVSVIPGMLKFNDAKIQILDVPGLLEGAKEGKGRGKEVLSVIRNCDLVVIITDLKRLDWIDKIIVELNKTGLRINDKKPSVKIEKKLSGGIIVHSNFKQPFDNQTIIEIAKEFKFTNAEITLKEKLTLERIIDAFSGNRVYIPAIFVVNKIDQPTIYNLQSSIYPLIKISAEKNIGLEELKNIIWKQLGFVKVYLVRNNIEPNYNEPIIMKHNQTLKEIAEKIGPEFASDKISAKIWGTMAKFPGQEVSLTSPIFDQMQVRFL